MTVRERPLTWKDAVSIAASLGLFLAILGSVAGCAVALWGPVH